MAKFVGVADNVDGAYAIGAEERIAHSANLAAVVADEASLFGEQGEHAVDAADVLFGFRMLAQTQLNRRMVLLLSNHSQTLHSSRSVALFLQIISREASYPKC